MSFIVYQLPKMGFCVWTILDGVESGQKTLVQLLLPVKFGESVGAIPCVVNREDQKHPRRNVGCASRQLSLRVVNPLAVYAQL